MKGNYIPSDSKTKVYKAITRRIMTIMKSSLDNDKRHEQQKSTTYPKQMADAHINQLNLAFFERFGRHPNATLTNTNTDKIL